MDVNKFNSRKNNNIKNYSNMHKKIRIKKGKVYRFFRALFLFIFIAIFGYLATLLVYSFLNREHCDEVVIPDFYEEEVENKKNTEESKDSNKAADKNKQQSFEPIRAVDFFWSDYGIFLGRNDPMKLEDYLEYYKEVGKNAVIVELKSELGGILYNSKVEKAQEWKTIINNTINVEDVLNKIKSRGFIPIARLNVLLDEKAPAADRENTYVYEEKYEKKHKKIFKFFDKKAEKNKTYLNPSTEAVQEYIIDLINEISELGFSHVLLENLNFPDVEFRKDMQDYNSIDRYKAIKEFIEKIKKRTKVNLIYGFNYSKFKDDRSRELVYGDGDIFKIGANKYMPIFYNYKDYLEFKRNAKINSSLVIPKFQFRVDLKKALEKVEAEKNSSYVIFKNSKECFNYKKSKKPTN